MVLFSTAGFASIPLISYQLHLNSNIKLQVGGHFGLLQCEGHVAKPLDARELAFYKQMTPRFRKFAPVYCGEYGSGDGVR